MVYNYEHKASNGSTVWRCINFIGVLQNHGIAAAAKIQELLHMVNWIAGRKFVTMVLFFFCALPMDEYCWQVELNSLRTQLACQARQLDQVTRPA